MVAVAGLELFRTNGNRFRIGAWRGDPDVGYLVPLESGRALSSTSIEGVVERLAQRGFDAVVTAALSPSEAKAFGSAGFSTIEELHLLSHPLDSIPQVDNHMALRPGRRWHRARMIEIDNRAFDAFWRFDSTSLSEAINATPRKRIRIGSTSPLLGYAVTGASSGVAYLQRLAVDPASQGQGLGSSLVVDALEWAKRRRASRCFVNTQMTNDRALSLYRRFGFISETDRLSVLRRAL
jgi:ribosomal-protein-alanine N-acetyltransferase